MWITWRTVGEKEIEESVFDAVFIEVEKRSRQAYSMYSTMDWLQWTIPRCPAEPGPKEKGRCGRQREMMGDQRNRSGNSIRCTGGNLVEGKKNEE